MARAQKPNASTRNVALKITTYKRLNKFLVELVRERQSRDITFDGAINELLNRAKN